EAAALYCMEKLEELRLSEGSTLMVVDCGGGTVDLTVRKLLSKNKLSEITERSGDLCGSTYVDDEFI
ncbi:9258_t:CDS:2, partial [Entrophospora sp. SA101]